MSEGRERLIGRAQSFELSVTIWKSMWQERPRTEGSK